MASKHLALKLGADTRSPS